MGALGTWNGNWIDDHPEWRALANMELSSELFVAEATKMKCFQELVQAFDEFLKARCEHLGFPFWSYQFEHSSKAQSEGRIHVHAFWHADGSRWNVGTSGAWSFRGAKCHLKTSEARGRNALPTFHRAHLYCQISKIGSMTGDSNFRKYIHFPVNQKWITGLWQQRKMTHKSAREEIIGARGHTLSYLREIDFIERTERKVKETKLREHVQAEIARNFKSFKVLPAVESWKLQYKPKEEGGILNVEPRFKFLVLNGPSCFGKTQFSKSLFGTTSTLVLSCQGVKSPCLRDFNREIHSAILFDEISSEIIAANKLVFQASVDGVELGQSQCNEHVYHVWLYGIPLIVSCNDWMASLPSASEEAKWLRTNAIVVEVVEPLWTASTE